MPIHVNKTVVLTVTCDHCEKQSEHTQNARDEWDNRAERSLNSKLRKAGWILRKGGTAGHSHESWFYYYCSKDCETKHKLETVGGED